MKKRALSALAVLLVCLTVLAGCGSYNYNLSEYVTLGQYEGLSVATAAIEAELSSAIDSLISSNTTTNNVTDRAVKDGDTVTIDYAGTMDGVAFEGGTASDQQLVIGSGSYIKGFESGLIGHNIDETVKLNLTFPSDYENNPDLAGKPAVFEVTIKGITETVVPEFDDALVASATEYKTVDEYKAAKREVIRNNLAWEIAKTNATILKYPKKEVKQYYDNMMTSYQNYAAAYGVTVESIIAAFSGTTDLDAFAANLVNTSKTYVKNDLIARKIVEEKGLTMTNEVYTRIATQFAAENSYDDLKTFEKAVGKDSIVGNVLLQLAIEYVGEHAVEVGEE